MKPVSTGTTNTVFIKKGCEDLPATEFVLQEDKKTMGIETCWELDEDELEQLNKTKRIYLYISGKIVPPMYLTTESQILNVVEGGKNDDRKSKN